MNMNAAIITTLALVLGFTTMGDEAPIRTFAKSQLSKDELKACDQFQKKRSKTRIGEAEIIKGIWPTCPVVTNTTDQIEIDYSKPSFVMKREAVIELLGKPDRESRNGKLTSLQYDLGRQNGAHHILIVTIERGRVIRTSRLSTT